MMTALVILPQAAFAAADTHQVPVKCYENYDDRFGYAVSPSHLAGSFSYGKPSLGTFRLLGSLNKETTLNGYPAYAVTDGLTIGYAILSDVVNREMRRINDIIYGGRVNAPNLSFQDNSYTFFTPNDTGTGIAYKGLVVFDLAVLNLTHLPILVHDSVVLKQISDEAIESILELYSTSGKQVVIALDKQDSFSPKTTKMLEENAVLKLASDGEELFCRFWGQQS